VVIAAYVKVGAGGPGPREAVEVVGAGEGEGEVEGEVEGEEVRGIGVMDCMSATFRPQPHVMICMTYLENTVKWCRRRSFEKRITR
jgi:hypothetical protein